MTKYFQHINIKCEFLRLFFQTFFFYRLNLQTKKKRPMGRFDVLFVNNIQITKPSVFAFKIQLNHPCRPMPLLLKNQLCLIMN